MQSSIAAARVLNQENAPSIKKASGRRRALAHERMQPSKVTQVTAFNRTRGILNLRRVLDGVVNVENEKAFKRGSSLQEAKMYSPLLSRQEVVQRSETSPLLRVSVLSSFQNSQDAAVKPLDDNQRIVRKPFNGKQNKETENLKSCPNEKQRVDPSVANEPENLSLDVENKQKGDPSVTNSTATTTPLMNVILEVSRPSSRASWHSPSSIEFSRASGQTPSSDVEDRPNMQLKDVIFDIPISRVPSKGRLCEKIIPSRVLRGSISYDVSRGRSFEDLITKEKKRKLAEYYSHPRFNVLGGRISCERSLGKQFFSNKDNTDAIGMAVKEECQKNKNVSVRTRSTKHKSRNLLRRLLCCSRQHTSSSSSMNSDFSVRLSRSRILKKSVVGTNTSHSCLTNKTTQTLFAHSGKLFPQDEKQDVKTFYIPKCDQSTVTEKETIEFQETGEKGVIPVHVKCSTILSLKNKVDGQTRTIKFSDNEIIIEVAGKDTVENSPKLERLVIEPSREYENALPHYLEINRTRSTKDIHIKTSKMDIPYVASIPAWIWNETPMIFTKNKRDTTFKNVNDRKETSDGPSTKVSSLAVPVIVGEEEIFQSNEQVEQKAENGNINPHKLISCYMVDVIKDPSSSNYHPNRNEGTVNDMNQQKTKVRKDTGTQTTFNFREKKNVFCQTADCPQRIRDADDPERELLYVDYERQRPADKSLNKPQHISESGSRMVLINISNEPDISVPPVIVNLSHATSSAFKAAAYEHEIEQMEALQRTASQLSSRQKTGVDAPLRTIKLNETTPDRRTITDSSHKEKITGDRHTNSQRIKGESLIGREGRSPKLEVQSNVKETDDYQEEPLPQIIATSRPFLHLGESELVQDQSSLDANPEVSRKIEEKRNSLSSLSARKSTTPRGNSENTTEKSQGSNEIPLPQQKRRQHFETDRNSLPGGGTEIDRKNDNQNSTSTRKTHTLDITEEKRSSPLKNAEILSRRATSLQQEKIKERQNSRSLLSEPQRISAIDNSKKASAAFKNSELSKEEKNMKKTNVEPTQSTSQSSFIKPSNTSVLFVLNDPKLFQGKGKRDRFAARAGVRAPPQRGKPRGFGPPAPPPSAGPGPKKGKGPQKVPLVFGSPSGSFDDSGNIEPKKEKAPEKEAKVLRSPSDDPEILPKKKEEKPQVTTKRRKTIKSSDDESDEKEITPFPVTMLPSQSTSSSVSSSIAGSRSESISSVMSPVKGETDSSKASGVSDLESSDTESFAERGRKSSRRSRRPSSRVSELRMSVRDSDVNPETIRSTIEKEVVSPQQEHDTPSTRVSEMRSSLRGSKFSPDMIISSVDEAPVTKPDIPSSIASEQRSSLGGSNVLPDTASVASKKSNVEKRPSPTPPRTSIRGSEFLPKLILSTTDDAMKSSKEQARSSSRMAEPRSVGGSTSSRASKQRVSGSDPDDLPRVFSTSDDARKSSKMRDRPSSPRVSDKDSRVLSERSRSTSDYAKTSSKSRDSSRSSEQRSSIRRSDFFPDAVLPTIYDASKSPSKSSARSTSGERHLLDGERVKPSGRSREGTAYSSKQSLYDSRSHSIPQEKDEDTSQFSRVHSIDIAKALERKYSLPDSDESYEESFQDTVTSKSRDLVTYLPDSSVIEPSFTDSDKLKSKEWDSSDLPTTVTEADIIPNESDSKYFAQVEDLEDKIEENEIEAMILHPLAKPLPIARDQVHVPYTRPDRRAPPCYVEARRIAREEGRHIHKDSYQPLPRTQKSALNNMCEMFCNIFPCCRKFSVCCKRKSAYARRTKPSPHAKQRKGRSSKSSITSSQLCEKCDKCESATMSLQGAPIIRQTDHPGQPDITVGYNFTNLYGVCMLALEQSNNSESVRVQNFAENIFSGAINPRVYDNSSSSCIFSDMQITNKRKDSKMCCSELSSNLSSKTFHDSKHIPPFPSQEAALNYTLSEEDGSEDSEKNMFTSTTPFTLTGTTTTPSGSNDFSLHCHERGFNSPPTTPCFFDLFSSSSKKLVLSEFYSKNYGKQKSLITQTKKKFQKKIDVNFQPMKEDMKKGNIFEEYTTNSGSKFTDNRNTENSTPHSLRQKWSNNYQHLVEKNDGIGQDVTGTWNKLNEDLTEGKVRKRRKQTVNYEPYCHVNEEHLKTKKKEFVYRLEKRCEIPSQEIIDNADAKNVTNDLKINLKDLYTKICKISKNEMQYPKTKK